MEKQITLKIDSDIVDDAMDVLDEAYLDIQSAVKILLKRIAREKSLSFLLPNSGVAIKSQQEIHKRENLVSDLPVSSDERGVTKSAAIRLFRNSGVNLNKNITFASKNRGLNIYWANPEFNMLKDDWFIILNDWERRQLHLFLIPANTIQPSLLMPRIDRGHLINLYITYDDISFTDEKSGYSFAKHLIKQIKY